MLEAQKCSPFLCFIHFFGTLWLDFPNMDHFLHFDMNEDVFPKIKIPVLKSTGIKVWV